MITISIMQALQELGKYMKDLNVFYENTKD